MDNSLCCSWVWKNQIGFAWHQNARPSRIHQVFTFVRECCPLPRPPLNVSAHIQHKVLHVALPEAEEVAAVVVRVGGLRPVVAVVTTSVISVTGVQTALMARNRDQVVSGSPPTPAIKDFGFLNISIILKFLFWYLPGLKCEAGKEVQVETMHRVRI